MLQGLEYLVSTCAGMISWIVAFPYWGSLGYFPTYLPTYLSILLRRDAGRFGR